MTVKELTERLEKMPQEAEVVLASSPMVPLQCVDWANDEWANQYKGKVVLGA